jgi:ABC-type polysaccharide/polyol phosphate export permease
MVEIRKFISVGIKNFIQAAKAYSLIHILGWQDVATRYRRSRIGVFWLTINTAVMIAVLATVFGVVFKQPIQEFLPYLSVSLILWGFISTSINEGCTSFISADGIILQVKMPLYIHVARVLWRNILIFAHNLIILPIVFILMAKSITWSSIFSLAAFFLIILNLAWFNIVLAIICSRFRDMTQVIQSLMQVSFYLTPIFWSSKLLSGKTGELILKLNPFYHLIEIFRAPLLGEEINLFSWLYCLCLLVFGFFISTYFFGKYAKRIAYWL